MLDRLAQVRGIENCTVHFQIDWCDDQRLRDAVFDLATNWTASKLAIFISQSHLGLNDNIFTGLDRAFNDDDHVLIVEDDVTLYHDSLEFVCRPEFEAAKAVCLHRRHETMPELDWDGWEYKPGFNAWGWALRRKAWEEIRPLFPREDRKEGPCSWDWRLSDDYFHKHENSLIFPKIGRSFNIGIDNGTHHHGYTHWMKCIYTRYWAGNLPRETT